MMFLSGARAEAHARSLARRLSDTGEEVRLVVHDRSRQLVGQARYGSAELV
jgi:UDP:flavonoid glycosyltransferase YjiC (YdhE family)